MYATMYVYMCSMVFAVCLHAVYVYDGILLVFDCE